ncbi:hypothetical protein [Kitasatospora sp. NPDC085879]|nr:hypothetical protein [Streptomyces sp. TLI_235]
MPSRPRRHRPDQTGHGLFMVRRLSTAWGHQAHPNGKTVWAELHGPGCR